MERLATRKVKEGVDFLEEDADGGDKIYRNIPSEWIQVTSKYSKLIRYK